MIKRLREEWLYWRYRNVTRRWLLLKSRVSRLRQRRPHAPGAGTVFRARGTAMYMPTRHTNGRGLLFVAATAAVMAVVNSFLRLGSGINFLDVLLFVAMAYAYVRYGGV